MADNEQLATTETGSVQGSAAETGAAAGDARPEELPPVEPPSAGHIVQLFLIPALIVAAVIGVWALFGMLASSETDWQQLVRELGSSNEDRRWRSALVLAQILRNEEIAPQLSEGTLLADEPRVAEALTKLLRESLDSPSTNDEVILHQEFLARTLGSLRVDDVTLPALGEALKPERNQEVRKSALMALASIAGRRFEAMAKDVERLEPEREYAAGAEVITLKRPLPAPTIADEAVVEQILLAARDEEPAIRHLAVFVLGVVSGPDATKELRLALLDGDLKTRANAVVALARNGLTDGFDVIYELLQQAASEGKAQDKTLSAQQRAKEQATRAFEQPMILSNVIRALDSIWVALSEEQRKSVIPLLQRIAEHHDAANIRVQAQELLNRVESH